MLADITDLASIDSKGGQDILIAISDKTNTYKVDR